MTFKPLKTSVAIASAVGLALAGLTAVPASAAVGDVIIAPNVGTGTTAFSTDAFTFETTVKTTQIAAATLTYRIDNPDQHKLHIDVNHGTADFWGIKSDGSYVETGVLGNDDGLTTANGAVVDFDLLDITSLVIFDMKGSNSPAATGNTLAISLDKGAPTAGAALLAATPLTYADALANPASITVNAWVETKAALANNVPADYATIDSDFASSSSLTFVHPNSVSVISKIDRSIGGTINEDFGDVVTAADVAISGTVDKSALVVDAEFDGVTLKDTDRVLLVTASGQTAADVGIYTVTSSTPTATSASFTGIAVVSGGDDFAGSLWLGDGTDTISLTDYTSNTEVANVLNDGSQKFLGSTLRFSDSGINLAQVDLDEWQADVVASNSDDISKINGEYFGQITPSGATDVDSFGYLALQQMVADFDLDDEATYSLKYRHTGDTLAPILNYSSAGYQVVASPSTLVLQTDVVPADSDNVTVSAWSTDNFPVSVRNGTAKVTFNGTVESASDVALEVANVPMLAVVTAGANWVAGETLTVSGATGSISSKNAVSIVTGLTNSDGEYSVSVTSSDTSSSYAAYSVEFFALKQASPDDAWIALSGDGTNAAKFDVDYAAAGLAATNAFTADSTVLSGDDVTVTFSVVDQYGEPMSSSAKGAAYSVELAAADTDDLELFAAVVDGEATFTFANFVGTGSSEVLTAKLFTGANTSPSYVAGQSEQMTLYNTDAVAGVNITDDDISTTVGYEDFITGLASSTNVAPTASADTLSGTVVDSNGAGIPGASVVLSGEGFQFLKTGGTSYSVDSISLNADEAGFWSVDMWTHSASTTGKDNLITVTSGTASGTIEVIAALAASISGGSLVMSWDLPSNPVYNTTYAVTGRVVDVWGNPVSGVNLDFAGEAAAEFNAQARVDKNTNTSGEVTVYLRSLKDVSGLAAVSMTAATGTRTLTDAGGLLTDVVGTSWDESSWVNPISQEITFLTSAVVASADQKVNVGSFKGFVALYAKGYEGQKMSAIVAGKWIVVESLASDFERVVRFTGAGYTITTKLYIDGEQVGDAFTTLTK
jgi:hypothetical protein